MCRCAPCRRLIAAADNLARPNVPWHHPEHVADRLAAALPLDRSGVSQLVPGQHCVQIRHAVESKGALGTASMGKKRWLTVPGRGPWYQRCRLRRAP